MRLVRFNFLLFVFVPITSCVAPRVRAAASAASPTCSSCAEWNAPQQPFRIYGNAYYVGTHGLASVLLTSPTGDVLIDGGLPESAPVIIANIRQLGFRVEDVKLILNTHVHFDHAGGIAELQRVSGAVVAASPSSASVLERGTVGPDDPQYGVVSPITPIPRVRLIADGETLHVGSLSVTAHFTAGHTPGGTSWSWRSCEGDHCLEVVYADSQTPVSADDFYFTRNNRYPGVLQDFERSFATLENLRCDILITPHPDASNLWARLARREHGEAGALVDPNACKAYVTRAREQLTRRITKEQAQQRAQQQAQ